MGNTQAQIKSINSEKVSYTLLLNPDQTDPDRKYILRGNFLLNVTPGVLTAVGGQEYSFVMYRSPNGYSYQSKGIWNATNFVPNEFYLADRPASEYLHADFRFLPVGDTLFIDSDTLMLYTTI